MLVNILKVDYADTTPDDQFYHGFKGAGVILELTCRK